MGEVLSIKSYSSTFAHRAGSTSKIHGDHSKKELASCFVRGRREKTDVLWLKENAEFLSVLRSSGPLSGEAKEALMEYLPFYEGSLRHFDFFKPYYRFILSICLDLEDLGIGDSALGERLAEDVKNSGVLGHELSDLQRAEARRLLARRDCDLLGLDGLDDRLRAFMQSSVAFAVPNRRTAYELTHVVFYLSDYGRQDPKVESGAIQSIEYAGVMAFLDQDADLLSEVCLALHFVGRDVPDAWMSWVQEQREACQMSIHPLENNEVDDYHTFLMMEWFISEVVKRPVFESFCERARRFIYSGSESVLRGMTMALYAMDAEGQRNRTGAIREMKSRLTERERTLLGHASQTIGCFDQFLCDFVARGYTSGSCRLLNGVR